MEEKREQGEVIEIEGPLVKIRMTPQEACGSCGQKSICFPAGRFRILVARAREELKVGDCVTIYAEPLPAIISSLLIFVGPIILGVGVLLLALAASAPVWMTAVSVGVSLLAYFLLLITLNNRLKRVGWFLPRAEKTQISLETGKDRK